MVPGVWYQYLVALFLRYTIITELSADVGKAMSMEYLQCDAIILLMLAHEKMPWWKGGPRGSRDDYTRTIILPDGE